jgi:hypothetical protein
MGGFDFLGQLGGSGGLGAAASAISPWIGPATSLLGLLGGGPKPLDPTQDPNYQKAQGYLGLQDALRGKYSDQADAAGQQYGQYNPQYLSAVNNQANYLKQDPYTDAYSANALAGATQGSAQAYQRANANLTASLASRGITDSSEMAGGLAGNAQAYAGNEAAAQNNIAQQKIGVADAHRNALISLMGGVANAGYGRQQAAQSNEGNLDRSLYGDYTNQANADFGRQTAANNQRNSLISGLGSGISDALDTGKNDMQDAQEAYLYHQSGYVKNANGDWVPGKDGNAMGSAGVTN